MHCILVQRFLDYIGLFTLLTFILCISMMVASNLNVWDNQSIDPGMCIGSGSGQKFTCSPLRMGSVDLMHKHTSHFESHSCAGLS